MALHLETAAITEAFNKLLSAATYGTTPLTFELYEDGNATPVDSFTRTSSQFSPASGTLFYDDLTSNPLVFTVAPGVADVNMIKLKGNFLSGGAQYVSQWELSATPTDYRPDLPNGGTLKLGQYIMSVTTE
ncbi:MAG: hypothetical protein RBS07_15085 [Lentimicrobium sp.]|jgi:hypothetical protein|nr:hypothetical protein [Lentimicrobium sp.]